MPNTTSQNAIEFRNVSLAFDDTPALTDISFVLHRGEMIFITGESGAGKSVLLKLAMGLLRPDAGQIFVGGVEIETLDEAALLAICRVAAAEFSRGFQPTERVHLDPSSLTRRRSYLRLYRGLKATAKFRHR